MMLNMAWWLKIIILQTFWTALLEVQKLEQVVAGLDC